MTIAVLIWQAIIFLTIACSGRWKGWITAFWVIWTIVQVATLPLSVIQFGTIALAFFMFGSSKPKAIPASPCPDPDEERKRLEAERERQEALARYRAEKSEKRKEGMIGMLLWGTPAVGLMLYQDAYGVSGITLIAFFICTFLLLHSCMKVLD